LYPSLVRYVGFPAIEDMIIQLAICAIFIAYYANNKVLYIKSKKVKILNKCFIILFLIILISSLINFNNFFAIGKSIVTFYFSFIFIFYIILTIRLNEREICKLLQLIFIMILIQLPIVIIQFIFDGGIDSDSISGTMSQSSSGGTGILIILITIISGYASVRLLFTGFTTKYFVLYFSTFIPVFTSDVRVGYFFIPFVFVLVFIYRNISYKKQRVSSILPLLITLIGLNISISYLVNDLSINYQHNKSTRTLITDMDNLLNYTGYYADNKRLGIFRAIYRDMQSPVNLLFGHGPSSIITSKLLNKEIIKYNTHNSSMKTMAKYFTSLGLIGVFILLYIFKVIMSLTMDYIKLENNLSLIQIAISFLIYCIIFILSTIYAPVWNTQSGIVLFLMAGLISNRYQYLESNHQILNTGSAP